MLINNVIPHDCQNVICWNPVFKISHINQFHNIINGPPKSNNITPKIKAITVKSPKKSINLLI